MGTEIWGREQVTNGGVPVINTDHGAVHLDYGAIAGDYFTLSNGASKTYCLTTPTNLYPHIKSLALNVLGGTCKLEVFEGADVTVNTGTAISIYNPNKAGSRTASSTIKESPTYTGGTLCLPPIVAMADSTKQTVTSASVIQSPNQEFVFDKNSQYIVKITNLTTDSVEVTWDYFSYEEPKGVVENGY